MENLKRKEIFVDGVNQIHFLGNMVRFDFVSLNPSEDGSSQAETQLIQRVVMTPQAFVNMFGSMQQLVDKLVANNVLGKQEGQN